MNYAKFTGALAGSIALKQYLEHQKIILENNYFFLYGQRCIDDWRRVSQRRCFHLARNYVAKYLSGGDGKAVLRENAA